jgi:AmmeMemoRadiSam system protein B
MTRKPAVAGQFYEASRSGLTDQVESYIEHDLSRESAVGIVSPHAGLMYSGAVAGAVYSRIKLPRTFILLGPNHTGLGSPVSIMSSGKWQMPTGEIEIDESIARELKGHTQLIEEDEKAHAMEHSLEVQLPFILHFSGGVKIVPIIMMTDSLDICKTLGQSLAEIIRGSKYPVTIIASSDMSHYVTDAAARPLDKRAIDRILDIDPEGLYQTVREEAISMCGVVPVTTMLYAARELGADKAELVKYMTSGEVSGDYNYVVGYAGLIIRNVEGENA